MAKKVMCVAKTKEMAMIDNFKKLLIHKLHLIKYLELISNNFSIAPDRVVELVAGYCTLDEVSSYEQYALMWGFQEMKETYGVGLDLIVDVKNIKLDENEGMINTYSPSFENVLEIQKNCYYTVKLDTVSFNLLLFNGVVKRTDIIKNTLIESEIRDKSYVVYENKRAVYNISKELLQGTYTMVPITVATVGRNCFEYSDGVLKLKEKQFEIIDGYHTACALERISNQKIVPVIVNFVSYKGEQEMKNAIIQMDHKNRLRRSRYVSKKERRN